MYLAFYNKEHVGDTLLLVRKETTKTVAHEEKGNITRVYIAENNETVAYNIFGISEYLNLSTGHVLLSEQEVSVVNQLLSEQGFEPITVDNSDKFVVGHVDECMPHPDSDHLHIVNVSVGEDKPLQIVCGAPNVAEGQLVVVAKVGAVMPNGLIIWEGALRGVASSGMLCSARELGLPNAPTQKGILVLEEGTIGQAFPMTVE